jgi:hypothetical protein
VSSKSVTEAEQREIDAARAIKEYFDSIGMGLKGTTALAAAKRALASTEGIRVIGSPVP